MSKKTTFSYRSEMPASIETLFAWHEAPKAFERLCPYWEKVKVLEHDPTSGIENGSQVTVALELAPAIKINWSLEHHSYKKNQNFSDRQITGPFEYWNHDHIFEQKNQNESVLEDRIEYKLPMGELGKIFGEAFSQAKLERLFRYRHQKTASDLKLINKYKGSETMKNILVSGATGLVGSQLCSFLEGAGHKVYRLVRSETGNEQDILWKPNDNHIDFEKLEKISNDLGIDAVVHLAGENIAAARWSPEQKNKIKESRIKGTTLLAASSAKLSKKPGVFVSASAIGFYGNRPNEILDENSEAGEDMQKDADRFLVETCKEWEAATKAAEAAGIRVAHTRFGIILDPKGGALSKLLLPFQMGAGGIIGNGKQFMSWVHIDDVIGAIYHAINTETVSGAVNVTAPNPVSNSEFTKVLGRVLWRPTIAPLPGFVARIMLGEMADALLLSSANVQPQKLKVTDYEFLYSDLESALRNLLGK